MLALGEIINNVPAVDFNFSASGPDIHPRYRSLPSAGANSKILNHRILLYKSIAVGFWAAWGCAAPA